MVSVDVKHHVYLLIVNQSPGEIKRREVSWTLTQNSELYYTRIKILGSCLFLQSVPANLHARRLHKNNSNNIDYRSNDQKDECQVRRKRKKER